jgi:hypothetical protein
MRKVQSLEPLQTTIEASSHAAIAKYADFQPSSAHGNDVPESFLVVEALGISLPFGSTTEGNILDAVD